jgi:peptidyl-tRNA hydrolase, PTH1 family
MIRLYAFLGNHGKQYSRNRHNIAWQALESLPLYDSLRWERGFKGRWAAQETVNGRVWLLMPETFMNLSGDSISELMRFHKITPDELLVIHDELEIPFGTLSLKRGGGLGGHNGLRSIRDRISTPDFLRFRIGIGRPDHDDIADYVLSDFGKEEREILASAVFPLAARILDRIQIEGFDAVEEEYRKIKAI